MKSYNDKIATYSVLVAVIAIVVTLATPEIRIWFGLEKEPSSEATKKNMEQPPSTNAEGDEGNPNQTILENNKSEINKSEINKSRTQTPTNPENKIQSKGSENKSVFTFTGTVVDKESNALAGIEVVWKDQKTNSQADGTFSFQVPNNMKGQDLKVVLSKNGKSYPPIENPSGTVFVFPPN